MAKTPLLQKSLRSLFDLLLVLGLLLLSVFITSPLSEAATFTVTNTNDSGAGSLRQAILDANANADTDIITIDASLSGGTITPSSSDFAAITASVTIDGSAPATSVTINAGGRSYGFSFSAGTSTVKGFTISGSTALGGIRITGGTVTVGGTGSTERVSISGNTQSGSGGLFMTGGSVTLVNSVLTGNFIGFRASGGSGTVGGSTSAERNIISLNSYNGIDLNGATNVTIRNNYIGTNSAGTTDQGNTQNGITVTNSSTNIVIQENLISGNDVNGIFIEGQSVTVKGNTIGLNAAGTLAIANSQNGVYIGNSNNTVGGDTTADRNIISGNTQSGVNLTGVRYTTSSNVVKMNYIGINAAGTGAVGNQFDGVAISNGATNNTIGGTSVGNVISGNVQNGIHITETTSTGNSIQGNTIGLAADNSTILGNSGAGIRVAADSTTIGTTNVSGARNIISSNAAYGVWINGADSMSIVNNYIGLASDGSTNRSNLGNGIEIDSTAASNTIGGTATGAGNTMRATNNICTHLASTAGSANAIRANSCLGGTNIVRDGGNGSIGIPSIDSTSTSSYVFGTSGTASGAVDIFANGTYIASTTANSSGAWSRAASYGAGTTLTATVTDSSGNTSASAATVTAATDNTAPSAPSVSSHSSNAYVNTATINLSGGKEADTSIFINGVSQVSTDASTTWTVSNYSVSEGSNVLSITSQDYTGNSSAATVLQINRDTVAPATPTVTAAPGTVAGSVTLTGSGTEAGAIVYVNDASTGSAVDSSGNFSVTYVLPLSGTQSVLVRVKDLAENSSNTVTLSITNAAGGGGGGGSGGGSSGYSVVGTDDEDSTGESEDDQSMSGEQEDDETTGTSTDSEENSSDDDVESSNVTGSSGSSSSSSSSTSSSDTNLSTTTNTSTSNSSSSSSSSSSSQPVKSFYSGIYEYLEPIKVTSPRDEYANVPLPEKQFSDKIWDSKPFKNKNKLGVPWILIRLKLDKVEPIQPTRDSDGDGLYDWEEVFHGSEINQSDSDADGISDLDEVYAGTDPSSYDTDGDGISDSEDAEPTIYNAPETDPIAVTDYISQSGLSSAPGVTDSDDDGLNDQQEITIETDPEDEDTDDDGLSDGDEVLIYATDPDNSTPGYAADDLVVANMSEEEEVEEGSQFLLGHTDEAETTVTVWEVEDDGDWVQVGEDTSDEEGRYAVLTDTEFTVGTHTLIVTTGGEDWTDVSKGITLNVVKSINKPLYVRLGIQDESVIYGQEPTLALEAFDNYMILVVWKSTIYAQTLIADSTNQIVETQPMEKLTYGEHTATWYAEDPELNRKSAPTQIAFTVAKTAFIDGQGNVSPLAVILGSIAILMSLSALAITLHKRKKQN